MLSETQLVEALEIGVRSMYARLGRGDLAAR